MGKSLGLPPSHLGSIKAALSHFCPGKSQGVILSLALQLREDEARSNAFHSELLEYVNREEREHLPNKGMKETFTDCRN